MQVRFSLENVFDEEKLSLFSLGCKPYMAPERIDPQGTGVSNYDIRSDVWSLGISLIEMATGKFPYATWKSPFEQLKQVVTEDSPSLPPGFSEPFEKLISICLQKDVNRRPNYEQLLANDFILEHTKKETDVAKYVEEILALRK
jgi:mitogen-activated protein kinase kinase 3